MIDSQGNRAYLMRCEQLAVNTTGVKVIYGPIYTTSIARLARIVYCGSANNMSLGVKLQNHAGNDITNEITLSAPVANVAYYYELKPSDLASGGSLEVKKGDVIRINVTTAAGSGNANLGLVID